MDNSSTLAYAGKTLFYHSNGSGRDSYIGFNQGGLAAPQARNIQPEKGSMNSREIHMKVNSPVIHSKPVYYSTNGTGRDSYIARSSGGLHSEYSPGSTRSSFYTNLRRYDDNSVSPRRRSVSPSPRGKKDVFLRSQQHFNSSHLANIKKMKTHQKLLDSRLSKPKFIKHKSAS